MTVATRHYAPRGDTIAVSYRGYRLEVTNRDVTVRDRHGRKLVTVTTMPAARAFIRGYRRETVKAEPVVANPAKATTAGSDKENLHA